MQLASLIGGHVETVGLKTSFRAAARLMAEREIGAVVVVDDHEILGVLTEHDITRAVAENLDLDVEAAERRFDQVHLAHPEWELEDAADLMLEHGFRHLPVVDTGRLVGMVSIKDIVWAMRAPGSSPTRET